MVEIFEDIPQRVKDQAELIFELALLQPNFISAVKTLNDYTNICVDDREREFVEFYFNMKMESLLNENSNDQR